MSRAAHENPTKRLEKDKKNTRAKRRKLMQPWMLPYNQKSDALQNHEENLAYRAGEMERSPDG
jgi:hypothetical protein